MKPDPADGLPLVGRHARRLGVRVAGLGVDKWDVNPDASGKVHPGMGMSVAVDEPHFLPKHRLPLSLGGDGRDPVFCLDWPPDVTGLALARNNSHGQIEPVVECTLGEFESALISTRPLWRKSHV